MSSLYLTTRFKSWELLSAELPVDVYRKDAHHLTFFGRSMTSHRVSVEPGSYFAVVQLPTGVQASGEATVREGATELVLELDPADESPNESQELSRFSWGYAPVADDDEFDRLAYERSAQLVAYTGNVFAGVSRHRSEFDLHARPEPTPPGTRVFDVRPEGVGFVQLRVSGEIPINIAVAGPPDPSDSEGYAMTVSSQPGGSFGIDARLRHVAADTLLAYAEHAQLGSAAAMTGSDALSAEQLLYEKRRSPVAAAVGAYALLRMGELERLHDWTANLMSWFPWLPDGLVVRAEHLARLGEQEQAVDLLNQLLQRGLPIFTDGLSLALDRLGSYLGQEGRTGSARRDALAALLLERLREYTPYVDFRKSLLTFTGPNPGSPEIRRLAAGDNVELVGRPVAPLVPAGMPG